MNLLKDLIILSQGVYFQSVINIKLLDDAIIRSNEPEEALTFSYQPPLNNRFVIPWRKVKGKLRRFVMEKQRRIGIMTSCHLKDDLCMQCPSCFMFGGTGETSSAKVSYNILARVLGETFISTTEVAEIQPYTENAVDEVNLTTGQALMTVVTVPKETEFLGVVTLRDPTLEMVSILVNNLERLTRLGAGTREWGRARTEILGYRISDREDLSAYDLVQENSIPSDLSKISDLKLPDVDNSYKKLDLEVKKLLKEHKLI